MHTPTSTTPTGPSPANGVTLSYREEMAFIHKAFRYEFDGLAAVVRSVPEDDRGRQEAVATWIEDLVAGLHHHHQIEDDLLWPVLRDRVGGDTDAAMLVAEMERQHDDLHHAMEAVSAAVAAWRTDFRSAPTERLALAIDHLAETASAHLDLEEAELCPLAQRHVSLAEWKRMEERGRKEAKGRKGRDNIGALLAHADDRERSWFLAGIPAPIRWLFVPIAERGYRKRKQLVGGAP
jgi:hemerythrin-like domain-containing protein